jgi:hypothetical protein
MTAKSLLLIPEGTRGSGGVWLRVLALFPHICQPLWLSSTLSSCRSEGSSCLPPGNLCPSHPPTGGAMGEATPPPHVVGAATARRSPRSATTHTPSPIPQLQRPLYWGDCSMVTPAGLALKNTCDSLAGTQLNSTLSPDCLSSSTAPS